MSVDDTKLNYLSSWDIDQLVETVTVGVTPGTTAIYTIPSTSTPVPIFMVQLLVSGRYYQAGTYSTDGTLAGLATFYSYISGNQIFINTGLAGTARCYVWTDKVDY